MQSFPPCPECGGPRAFFEYRVEGNKTFIYLSAFFISVDLFAVRLCC